MGAGVFGSKKNIAIIPARGGSKRIPNKNIIDFFGKPMIVWTIEACKQSGCFDRILVSTDDQDIADISKNAGAEVPFLRTKANDDFSPVVDATIWTLYEAEKYYNEKYEIVAQLMPNCPMRDDKDINNLISEFNQLNSVSSLSFFKFSWMNPWWSHRKLDLLGRASPLFPECLKQRSQDLGELFCPSGAIWISRSDSLKQNKTFYIENFRMSEISLYSAIDIDNYEDLDFAKAAFVIKNNLIPKDCEK